MSSAPAPTSPARLAVLVSGGGRTLLNLSDSIRRGELNAVIGVVIASGECAAAARAVERQIPIEVVPGRIPKGTLSGILARYHIDWVVLAGYLHLVDIPEGYNGRVVNIHPALLPRFGGPGMFGRRVHQAVLDSGEPRSGCTVHLCDARYDTGPIVLQRTCPVVAGDTPESLAARVFALECEAYPAALKVLIEGKKP